MDFDGEREESDPIRPQKGKEPRRALPSRAGAVLPQACSGAGGAAPAMELGSGHASREGRATRLETFVRTWLANGQGPWCHAVLLGYLPLAPDKRIEIDAAEHFPMQETCVRWLGSILSIHTRTY